ncbi:hypothetical protein AR457_07600 [Streptomyces agglomeratus]|uniref:YCII-related domain-containing protein n=1 Tax=Streptomyces agglomeratus TaxID=285458 RepID=A0A1E5P4E6_9ACTN|nr:hypothetical protein AS594_07835 [Streptomyces agglomeratus]OEJ41632.1 hypothetical protein BGK70_29050 [Streptomyces agglomeratus]OEJ43989.1 hypothetical protein AR457_07600 [Streptomyces agglomeratus]OEJ54123.1 hypothetical protein BGK72_28350 [Streptomyces agglomeratus]OEJ61495.1 hypothetical protein BGM19_29270 [Streptomyces agglomeratus]
MYLVHIHLVPHPRGDLLPDCTRAAITAAAADIAEVVHIALHPDAKPGPVIGVYLAFDSLRAAEAAALDIWDAARCRHAYLRNWELVRAEVPIMPIMPGYDG